MKAVLYLFLCFSISISFGQNTSEEIRERVTEFSLDTSFLDTDLVMEIYQQAKTFDDPSLKSLVQFLGEITAFRNRESDKISRYSDDLYSFLSYIDSWEVNKDTLNLMVGYSFIAEGLYRAGVYEYVIVYFERKLNLNRTDKNSTQDIYKLVDSHIKRANYGPAITSIKTYLPELEKVGIENDSLHFLFNNLLIEAYLGLINYEMCMKLANENLQLSNSLSDSKKIEAYFDLIHVTYSVEQPIQPIIDSMLTNFRNLPDTHDEISFRLIKFYKDNNLADQASSKLEKYIDDNQGSNKISYINALFLKATILYNNGDFRKAFKLLNELLNKYEKRVSRSELEKFELLASISAEKIGRNKAALIHLRKHIKIRDELREVRIKKRKTTEALQFWFQNTKNKVEFNSRLNNFNTIDANTKSLERSKQEQLEAENIANRRFYIILISLLILVFGAIILYYTWKTKKANKKLLLNILPQKLIDKISKKESTIESVDKTTVLFTDFKGFTMIAEELSAEELVAELNECFGAFDAIMERHNLEKIKTIGDAYMAAGGIPERNDTNPEDAVFAALEIVDFIESFNLERKTNKQPLWNIRIGIHTGHVVAGVIGTHKYSYDIWGDAVNLASRMESSGEAGKVNISEHTYELIKDKFECTYRGEVKAKNKGNVKMYFVDGRKK